MATLPARPSPSRSFMRASVNCLSTVSVDKNGLNSQPNSSEHGVWMLARRELSKRCPSGSERQSRRTDGRHNDWLLTPKIPWTLTAVWACLPRQDRRDAGRSGLAKARGCSGRDRRIGVLRSIDLSTSIAHSSPSLRRRNVLRHIAGSCGGPGRASFRMPTE